jgi:hypothetical protein
MFPVIEVECPYCKATGQIMTPPLGSIIIGPCPRCNEMVLLFDGTVMPLDRDIIAEGTPEEKKQHLLEAIVDMAAGKIDELIDSGELGSRSADDQNTGRPTTRDTKRIRPSIQDTDAPSISRQDVRDFINIDLHLIDSKDYFDKVFTLKKRGKT